MRLSVESLYYYPLTGAQGDACERSAIIAAGLGCDRLFVLYDSTIDGTEAPNRISQKQIRELARLKAMRVRDKDVAYRVMGDGLDVTLESVYDEIEPNVIVNEFGDQTPAIDMGDELAVAFSEALRKPHIRVAEKHSSWYEVGDDKVSKRKVAPLHIVTTASVEELQKKPNQTVLVLSVLGPILSWIVMNLLL